jgi:hypothetical protein
MNNFLIGCATPWLIIAFAIFLALLFFAIGGGFSGGMVVGL